MSDETQQITEQTCEVVCAPANEGRIPPEFVIITGLSGAGKTQAIHCLEDMGFYCVDNLPPALIPQFAELCAHSQGHVPRVAVVTDIRGGYFFQDLYDVVLSLRSLEYKPRLVFLEASEETLVRRFKETRRRHPLASRHRTLLESIRLERKKMQALRAGADKVIDTTATNPNSLKEEISALFSDKARSSQMLVNVLSFGYKFGIPVDADLLFDVRFLRNPHYVPELQPLTGADPAVRDYVLEDPDAHVYLDKIKDMLLFLLPRYSNEGRSYLTVGIGCTGGHHRSVVFACLLADYLREQGYEIVLDHRDLKKVR
ncbi:MAG: RNase adapter RapZ [Armatimonadota bacterium]